MRDVPRQFYWNIPIPHTVFLELAEYLKAKASNMEIGDLAGIALRDWLARQNRVGPTGSEESRRAQPGYQWKRLFLPDGTLLRTIFKSRTFMAQIEEGRLVHEGRPMSAHEFANSPGGGRRNAWETVWLLFPGQSDWRLAADCRPARSTT
jgi:hypothetical protein